MNLLRLKKSRLVEICAKEGVTPKGTIAVLKEKLLKTGKHWELKYIKINPKKLKYEAHTVPRQVSKVTFVSFDQWMVNLECWMGIDRYDNLEVPFRDYFDQGFSEEEAMRDLKDKVYYK